MKRQFNFPKNQIADQIRDWDDVVVLGTKNGEPHFLSNSDERTSRSILDKARDLETTG